MWKTVYKTMQLSNHRVVEIFDSAVFGENQRYCYDPCGVIVCRCHAKTMTFCHISAITEHIYLKVKPYVHNKKRNMYKQGK